MCPSFPFGFEGGIWDFIVLVPDHSFLFTLTQIGDYKASLDIKAQEIKNYLFFI